MRHAHAQRTLFAILVPLALISVACDDDNSSEDEGASVADPDCDALLTPADFADVCGAELTLEPTSFEGIELNPCNRTAADNAAILLVSRHTSASVAAQGADIAGGRGPNLQTDLNVSAGSASVFVVEVKAKDDPAAVCSADALPMLLDLALSRVAPAGG